MNSRERQLESMIANLQWNKALDALDLVREQMCVEKGFKRFDGSDYYLHPVEVALMLLNFGVRDEDIIVAALLHDVIEDIKGYTNVTISERFGRKVSRIVVAVTKSRDIDYKVLENLQNYINGTSEEIGSALIKTVDRLHNFYTLGDATPKHKLKQAKETKEIFIPFFKKCRNAYPRYAPVFYSAKTSIEPLIREIEEHYEDIRTLKKAYDLSIWIEKLKSINNQLCNSEIDNLISEMMESNTKLESMFKDI